MRWWRPFRSRCFRLWGFSEVVPFLQDSTYTERGTRILLRVAVCAWLGMARLSRKTSSPRSLNGPAIWRSARSAVLFRTTGL